MLTVIDEYLVFESINKFSLLPYENYDILENEKQKDKELKERILLKVKYNKNRFFTETQNYEKNKLIEKNSTAEFGSHMY